MSDLSPPEASARPLPHPGTSGPEPRPQTEPALVGEPEVEDDSEDKTFFRADLLRRVRRYFADNGTLLTMYAVVFVNLVGFSLVVPLIPTFRERFAVDAWQVTLIFPAYSLGQLFAEPWFGRLSDRIGRKPVIFWTMASNLLFYLCLAFAPNIWMAILARFFNGIGAANISTIQGYVTDKSTPQQRTGRLGMIGAAFSLGFMTGPILSFLGPHTSGREAFAIPVYIAAALSGLCALAVLLFVRESRKPVSSAVKNINLRAAFSDVRRDPVLSRIILTSLLYMFAMATLESTFGLWVQARYHWGKSEIALILLVIGAVSAVMQMALLRPLTRRFGEHAVLSVGLGVFGAGFILQFVNHVEALTTPFVVVAAAGQAVVFSTISAMLSKAAGLDRQGTILGFNMSVGAIARIIGPVMAGLMFSHLSEDAPLWFACATCWTAAWLAWRTGRDGRAQLRASA